jgi:branched-chain amino acid transport system ATP-binding protein
MLECRGISVAYGQHRALADVSVTVAAGEIVVILGANGAGKSTLLKAIAGLVPCAEAGQIRVDGRSLAGLAPHEIVEAGVALVPEGRQLFGDLTVEENLLLGAHARRARAAERANLERVLALFPRLAERRRQVARTLSGGEQQMVAIGRAVMSAPAVLMLDEPSLGLSPLLCTELFRTLREVRATGVGILLVEQNARQALAIAERGYLLEVGRIVGEDAARALAQDPAVQEAYLGGGRAGPAEAAPLEKPVAPPTAVAATAPAAAAAPSPAPPGAVGPAARPGVALRPPPPGALAAGVSAANRIAADAIAASPFAAGAGSRTDVLAGRSIAALVQHAAEVQAEHVHAMRGAGGGLRPAGAPGEPGGMGAPGGLGGGPDALAAALARVEQAAALARTRRPVPRAGVSSRGGNGSAATLERPRGSTSGTASAGAAGAQPEEPGPAAGPRPDRARD